VRAEGSSLTARSACLPACPRRPEKRSRIRPTRAGLPPETYLRCEVHAEGEIDGGRKAIGVSVRAVTDVVLVHGTTQSSAGFNRLVAALERRGHRAFAVDAPSNATAAAAGFATLLAAQLPDDIERPVVVAHSAGGLLLPALARRLDARHQVWLAAAVADYAGGRSFIAEVRADPTAVVNPEWLGVDPSSDPALATRFLFHDADPVALAETLPTVQIFDWDTIYAEVPAEDPARVPSTYVLPRDDRTLRPQWMARVARERLHVEPIEIAGAHNFYVASPEAVADQIDRAAQSASGKASHSSQVRSRPI
jgi:pimeloyl-ACP methyl ester carboxylesterase